jgi:hypothetical protein
MLDDDVMKKIYAVPNVYNNTLMTVFADSRFKSFGVLTDHIVPLTNAEDQKESISIMQGLLTNYSTAKLDIKSLVFDVVKAKPLNFEINST